MIICNYDVFPSWTFISFILGIKFVHATLADLNKGSKEAVGRLRRFSRWNAHPSQSVYSKIEAVGNEVNALIPTANDSKQKRGRTSTAVSSADKVTLIFLYSILFVCTMYNVLCI